MPIPVVSRIYVATHTKGLGGVKIKKGNRYTCLWVFNDPEKVLISGMYLDATKVSRKFFDENFIELDKADQLKTKTLKLTQREADWLKYFFSKYINDIADLDGGTDYKALMTVSDKIEKL
jgi:hypothetical protein